jgi:hypothetical protein
MKLAYPLRPCHMKINNIVSISRIECCKVTRAELATCIITTPHEIHIFIMCFCLRGGGHTALHDHFFKDDLAYWNVIYLIHNNMCSAKLCENMQCTIS